MIRSHARIGLLALASGWGGCGGTQPPVARPELSGVRLVLKSPIDVTWSDSACASQADAQRTAAQKGAQAALEKAGFAVVEEGASKEAVASVSLKLTRCATDIAYGDVTIAIDAAKVTKHCESCHPGLITHMDEIIAQLAEAPAVTALGKAHADAEAAEKAKAEAAVEKPKAAPPPAKTAKKDEPKDEPADKPEDTAPPPPPAAKYVSGAEQKNAFALIVGVEKYRDVPNPAAGARVDATRFMIIARNTLGVPGDQIKMIVDDHAAASDLKKGLDWLKASVPAGGRAYFYYSGSGARDASGTAYLLPYDSELGSISATAFELDAVLKALNDTKGKEVVAFVDACFAPSKDGGRCVAPEGKAPSKSKDPTPGGKVALYLASGGSEIAGPGATGTGGLFSFQLAEGLGKGNGDLDGDGTITLQELTQWVSGRVSRQAKKDNRDQTPALLTGKSVNAGSLNVAWNLPAK
jgi:hypothetical protein